MAEVLLIKRGAPTCAACNVMQAKLEGEGIAHDVIDITEDRAAVSRYGLTTVPVTIIRNGGITTELNGLQPIERIKELID